MRCVVISDTHTLHWELVIPDGDVLIHAGDALSRGSLEELADFNDWLLTLPHKHKIVIAGNHDWCFERKEEADRAKTLLTAATYLQDSGVEIDGVYFYGSPWQPAFRHWAFNLERGKPLAEKWQKIPANTDVLITHGPPMGVLDKTTDGESVGCFDLRAAVNRIKPRFHVFGHIHESYGKVEKDGTVFINACICTERYRPVNRPIVFDISV
jgi:Icc-related predicted phosphoesterase